MNRQKIIERLVSGETGGDLAYNIAQACGLNNLGPVDTSPEAALALKEEVLPGWWVEEASEDIMADQQSGIITRLGWAVELWRYDRTPVLATADTLAAALCIAILKATDLERKES